MTPLAPREEPPPEEPEPEPPPAPEVAQRVIARTRSIGWHHFYSTEVVAAAWPEAPVDERSGEERVEALGRTLEGCRADDDVTFCPEVGVVRRRYREGSWTVEEPPAMTSA